MFRRVKSIPANARQIPIPSDYLEAMALLARVGAPGDGVIHEIWETDDAYYFVYTPEGYTSAVIVKAPKIF